MLRKIYNKTTATGLNLLLLLFESYIGTISLNIRDLYLTI